LGFAGWGSKRLLFEKLLKNLPRNKATRNPIVATYIIRWNPGAKLRGIISIEESTSYQRLKEASRKVGLTKAKGKRKKRESVQDALKVLTYLLTLTKNRLCSKA